MVVYIVAFAADVRGKTSLDFPHDKLVIGIQPVFVSTWELETHFEVVPMNWEMKEDKLGKVSSEALSLWLLAWLWRRGKNGLL